MRRELKLGKDELGRPTSEIVETPHTQAEIDRKVDKQAQHDADKPERDRPKVYDVAQDEFTRRALLVANVNGPQTDKTLNLAWNRFKRTSDPRADQIDAIDDNRVSLIDGIEAAADPSTIDPTAEEHWS